MTAATAARAQVTIAALIQISLPPAPIGGTSALTADFVATMQMRDGTGKPETRSIDGHALDFGEVVVRQAAYERAAEPVRRKSFNAAMRD